MSATATEVRADVPSTAPAGPDALLPLPGRLRPRALLVRTVGFALLIVGIFTMPSLMSWAGPTYALAIGVIVAMAVLSVSVLGWIGEISMASLAQMGMGVVILNYMQDHGVAFAAIVPIAVLCSIPVSLVLGVFALRLRGVYFAIATLAFATLAQKSFFQSYLGTQGGFEKPLERPSYLNSDKHVYYLEVGTLAVLAVICYLILRSSIGTRLTALRDSEMAFAVLGHSPARYKLFTVCLSGAIATLAGTYYGILQQVVPANYFNPGLAIAYFAYAVVGGLGSVGGAITAGVVFGSTPRYLETLSHGKLVGYDLFFAAAVALVIILWVPGGIAALGRRIWSRIEGIPR
ncbi:MAG TPA: branched-chain amino acid ABC transporter permease [Sporichthyaceae bacterium]|jgi:branched-chain amino acid transport system permease protein